MTPPDSPSDPLVGHIIDDPFLAWAFEESLWGLWDDQSIYIKDLEPED